MEMDYPVSIKELWQGLTGDNLPVYNVHVDQVDKTCKHLKKLFCNNLVFILRS